MTKAKPKELIQMTEDQYANLVELIEQALHPKVEWQFSAEAMARNALDETLVAVLRVSRALFDIRHPNSRLKRNYDGS